MLGDLLQVLDDNTVYSDGVVKRSSETSNETKSKNHESQHCYLLHVLVIQQVSMSLTEVGAGGTNPNW